MLVKLKRDFFDGATFHPKDVAFEYNGNAEDLPKDALIIEGHLPVASNSPKPGFGAKPLEAQIMDMAGAGPTHQIDVTSSPSERSLTDEEKEKEEDEASKQREAERKEDAKETEAARKEEAKGLAEGLKAAEKAAEKVIPTVDPFASTETKKGK